MSKLERYIEFNWPALASGVDGSAEDQAIHVMRKLGEGLDRDSRELARVTQQRDELATLLRQSLDDLEQVGDEDAEAWIEAARAALAKAAGKGGV